jgi:type VI secretion system protein ImpM
MDQTSVISARPELVNGAQLPKFFSYGKIPGAGDFVSRRMPYALQQFWDRWCAAGMDALKTGNNISGWEFWRGTPTWSFLLSVQPNFPFGQFGILAPSCDRVGRNFPFLVTAPLLHNSCELLLSHAASLGLAWCEVISRAQRGKLGINELDARLETALADVLAIGTQVEDADRTLPRGMNPSTLPWPNLATTFDANNLENYWWSVPPISTGFRARIHLGTLSSMHFLELSA